jgi:hypothetical protein
MTNPKKVLSVGLAAATLALVLPFLAGGFLSLSFEGPAKWIFLGSIFFT